MNAKCQGKNCQSTDGTNHSIECLFEHFLAYTGFHNQQADAREALRKAYYDGYDAGRVESNHDA